MGESGISLPIRRRALSCGDSFYRNASMYLHYLRILDKKSEVMEQKLHGSPKNQEIIELLEMQKSLVYFTTSLRVNEVVLEKLLKVESIKKYPEDTDLLEDIITENKQAIEMAHVYTGILNSMMDTFSSVISNNVNGVMKFLTTITIGNGDSHHGIQRLRNEPESQRNPVFRQS